MNELSLFPKYHQLDIESQDSIKSFSKHLSLLYEGIDILVNNAGIMNQVRTFDKYLNNVSLPNRTVPKLFEFFVAI